LPLSILGGKYFVAPQFHLDLLSDVSLGHVKTELAVVAGKKGSRDRGVADGIASVAVVPLGNSIRLDQSRVDLASFGHFEVGLLHL
jgi:hypothetical protein